MTARLICLLCLLWWGVAQAMLARQALSPAAPLPGPATFTAHTPTPDENRLTEWRHSAGPAAGSLASTFVYDGLGRLRTRGEFQGDGSSWVLQGVVNYVYDGRRVIQERDGNNWPLVAYTRGTDLSGTLEGAGGIGGLLARSHGFTNCSTTITYNIANNSGYCIYDLAVWDDYEGYTGVTIASGDGAQFVLTGVPGHSYYAYLWVELRFLLHTDLLRGEEGVSSQ